MLAYKYRSSEQIDKVFDIIFNNRLYCSDWNNLNDPMEGVFEYTYNGIHKVDAKKQIEEVITSKQRIKVCSLSKTYRSHLLWSHYANGFDGVSVEVNIDITDSKIKNIKYWDLFTVVTVPFIENPEKIANQILTQKYKEWKYEKEIRILNQDEWYYLKQPVKHIITGHRIKPALYDALKIICQSKDIILSTTKIETNGINLIEMFNPKWNLVNSI